MAPREVYSVVFALLLVGGIHATEQSDEIHVAIFQRLANIEDVQTEYVSQTKALQAKVNDLEKKNVDLEQQLKNGQFENVQMKRQLQALVVKQEELTKTTLTQQMPNNVPISSIHRRQTQGSANVAFSTFLDHDYDNLGPEQVIVFNQVQLNDGDGYNNITGAFTVPISGVYVFTFFVGERDSNQLYVKLVVNGVSKSDAVAETVQSAHDSQGGNVVVLRVNQGDVVLVEHNTWGSHIEGYPDIRLSTFSGFLLYQTDDELEVVGK